MLLIAVCLPARSQAYTLADGMAYSEPIPILRAVQGWKGTDRRGSRQYASLWTEAGVARGRWGAGLLHRLDFSLHFTPDAAALYGAIADDHPLPVGRTYHIYVHAHAMEAWGVRVFHRYEPAAGMRAEVGLSLLRGVSMLEGSIQGEGTALAAKRYDYNLWADDAYTKDPLFSRDVRAPEGVGASLDGAFGWDMSRDWHLQARVRDLPGFVRWRHLPMTRASALSQRTHTDDQDFQHWAPLVSGLETYAPSYRQDLPASGAAEITHASHSWIAGLGTTYVFGDWSPRVGIGHRTAGWQWVGWVWPTKRALGVDVRRGPWGLSLSSDGFDGNRVHFVQICLGYGWGG
jgi:hypothetical protein